MSGKHGLIHHRTGYYFTILEEDYCELYKQEGANEICRAFITSILEHLTNKQFETQGCQNDIWVYMSIPEMARRMRHACSERTIHKELKGMIEEGYLAKRRATGKATMEYKLDFKKINDQLARLPEKQSCNSSTDNLANLQDQSCNSATSILQNCKDDLAELQPRIKGDRQKNKQEEEESKDAARVSPPTPISSSSQTEKPQQGSLIPDTKKKSGKQAEASPQAEVIIERWEAANGKSFPRTESLVQAAESLVPCDPSKQELICIRNFVKQNDRKNWYGTHGGVTLSTIAKEYEGWQNSQNQVQAEQPPPPPIPLKPMKSRLVQELDEKRQRYAAKKG